jgi:hypothetical protein
VESGVGEAYEDMFRERSRNAVSPVRMSHLSLRTIAPLPCLPLDIKDSLKEDTFIFLMKGGFLMGVFG